MSTFKALGALELTAISIHSSILRILIECMFHQRQITVSHLLVSRGGSRDYTLIPESQLGFLAVGNFLKPMFTARGSKLPQGFACISQCYTVPDVMSSDVTNSGI